MKNKDGYFTVWAAVVSGIVMLVIILTFIPLNNSSKMVHDRFEQLNEFLQEQTEAERALAAGNA